MSKKRAEVKKRLLYFGIIFVAILLLLVFVSDFILGKTTVFLTLKEAVKELIFDTWKSFVGERTLFGPCNPSYQDSISQYNITWFFDGCYRVGQFVNGDWWVVGPLTVLRVEPSPFYLEHKAGNNVCYSYDKSRCTEFSGYEVQCFNLKCDYNYARNGSVVNPVTGVQQGYDSRIVDYNYSLSIYYPVILLPNQSLVSTISHFTNTTHKNLLGLFVPLEHSKIQTAAVLTVLDGPSSSSVFRPPFVGSKKPLFDSTRLRTDLLPNLQLTAGAFAPFPANANLNVSASVQQYIRYFQRPWIGIHKFDFAAYLLNPTDNMPAYYRESYAIESDAALLLLANVSNRDTLLMYFIQHGIDNWGTVESAALHNTSGSRELSKWPTLFAGIMLDEPQLKSPSFQPTEAGSWRETFQTYYGQGWTGATALWRDKPGLEYEHIPPSLWYSVLYSGGCGCNVEGYRRNTHSHIWVGSALAIHIMKAESLWNAQPFLDYMDRWMTEPDAANLATIYQECGKNQTSGGLHPNCGSYSANFYSEGTASSAFSKNMWDTYRNYSTSPIICVDSDIDGFSVTGGSCGTVDCNDANATIKPGAVEICTDSVDNDCDGLIDNNDNNCAVVDTTPPVISFITNSSITNQSAIVSWLTNENANSRIYYGLTTNFGSESLDLDYLVAHSLQLVNLLSNTVYYYKVGSCDVSGNCANSSLFNFKTTAGAFVDSEGPIVSLSSPVNGNDLSSNSVTFSYTPNDFSSISSCTLYFGVETRVDSAIENSIENNFSVNLANGAYYWSISCVDSSGNRGESETRILNINYQEPVYTESSGGGGYSSGGGGGYIAPQPKVDSIKNETLISEQGIDKISLQEGEVGFVDIGLLDSVVLDLYDVLYEVRFELTDKGVLLKVPNGDYLIPKDDILPVLLGGQEMYVAVKRADSDGAGIILGLNRELVREQLGESAVEQRTGTAYIIIGIIIFIIGIFALAGYILHRRDKIKNVVSDL